MANRKVLINRHTSGSLAPQADSMYLGEIAVAHETGKETLFTKNNAGNMVPFISCAQTITMINNAISAANVTYDVKAAEGDDHIEVASDGTEKAKVFTVSSKDVQSKAAFNAYSAATDATIKENYNTLSGAINDVLDIITTAITGDDIISIDPTTSGAGTYALAHKKALTTNGFNKLATDAYGHVTAATAVSASDIEGLGFKDSAWTEEKIASAINALDSSISASSAGKYFTALAIENGKLVAKEEANIPVLEVESVGTGNVVASIAVADHKITYQTASVATSEDIEKLSAATMNLSAVTGEFSGATDSRINALSSYTEAVDDKVEKLSAATISISGFAHGEIAELSAATSAVSVDVKNLSAATLALSAVTLTGISLNNTPLAVSDHVISVPVTTSGSGIASTSATGSVADAKAVKEYVEDVLSSSVNYKGATASTPASAVKGDLYIASADFMIGSDKVETGDFIIYNGAGWDVIEKNLDGAITGSLTQDTVILGNSVNSVKSIANGTSGQVLTIANGVPTWVDDIELSVVSAGTGNVISNITVNDHEITFTKDITAAKDADLQTLSGAVVAKDYAIAQALNDLNDKATALSAYTEDVDNKVKALSANVVTYIDEQIDDVYASGVSYTDAKVAAEIALLDSVGSASTTGHYLTSVTITNGKISAIGEESIPAATPVTTVAGTTGDTASAVLTGITTGGTDGHQLTLNASNKIFSAETSDSAITSVSAQTSVSAVSSVSAITSESADTADKVANALSFSGYSVSSASTLDAAISYDGSAARSLTFGTNGNAGLKSMSMTSAGVVDVEVIDCGEY